MLFPLFMRQVVFKPEAYGQLVDHLAARNFPQSMLERAELTLALITCNHCPNKT